HHSHTAHIPCPCHTGRPLQGLVVARGTTVLHCLAAPSGLLTGLHLPSFAKNLVATSVLQDQWVAVTQPGGELVAICTDSRTGEHLATFTRRPGSGLCTLTTESALVAESGQVAALVEVVASCSCCLLTHQTLLWHHHLGHPSLPRLRGMHSHLLVPGLPRSLPICGGRARLVMRCRIGSWVPFCLFANPAQGSSLPALFDASSLASLTMPRAGSFTTRVLVVFSPPRTLPLTSLSESTISTPTAVPPYPSRLLHWSLTPPVEVFSDTSGPADPTPAATVTPRRSARIAVPLGIPPRPSSPPLQHVAVDSGAAGDGTTGDAGFEGAGSGGAGSGGVECPLGTRGTGGTGAGGPGTSRQEALSPEQLREWAVQWGSPGGGASRLGVGGAGTAGAGGAGAIGAGGSATGGTGVASAGDTGSCRQENLSPEWLREWVVQWGSPGGGASHACITRAGGAGTPGVAGGTGVASAVGAAAGNPGSRRQDSLSQEQLGEWAVRWGSPGGGAGRAGAAGSGGASPGNTGAAGGTRGAGAAGGTRGAGPGGASAGVPRVGHAGGTGTGGRADTGGTTRGTTGVSGASRQESLSPLQLREWAVRWGSPGDGAGGTGSRGAVATGAGGSEGATTQLQSSELCHLLSLPPAATEFLVAGTTPPLLFPPTDQSQPQLLPGSLLPAPAPHTEVTASLTARGEPETRASTPECQEPETIPSVPARVRRPPPPAMPGTHDMTL
ncbi:unnamed protein product, partial [Closterium sp. NIES-54]